MAPCQELGLPYTPTCHILISVSELFKRLVNRDREAARAAEQEQHRVRLQQQRAAQAARQAQLEYRQWCDRHLEFLRLLNVRELLEEAARYHKMSKRKIALINQKIQHEVSESEPHGGYEGSGVTSYTRTSLLIGYLLPKRYYVGFVGSSSGAYSRPDLGVASRAGRYFSRSSDASITWVTHLDETISVPAMEDSAAINRARKALEDALVATVRRS